MFLTCSGILVNSFLSEKVRLLPWRSGTSLSWSLFLLCSWAAVCHVSLPFVYVVITLPFVLCLWGVFDFCLLGSQFFFTSLCRPCCPWKTSLVTPALFGLFPLWHRTWSHPYHLTATCCPGLCPLMAVFVQVFYFLSKILHFKWTVRVFVLL